MSDPNALIDQFTEYAEAIQANIMFRRQLETGEQSSSETKTLLSELGGQYIGLASSLNLLAEEIAPHVTDRIAEALLLASECVVRNPARFERDLPALFAKLRSRKLSAAETFEALQERMRGEGATHREVATKWIEDHPDDEQDIAYYKKRSENVTAKQNRSNRPKS